jgi:hypothetical protein
MPEQPPPAECANCGAAISRAARACPECGADERTGWRETSLSDDLDLPDHAFEGDHGPSHPPRRSVNRLAWLWWTVAAMLLALLLLSAFPFH